jgi:thiamine biosynthesis lipoprotein
LSSPGSGTAGSTLAAPGSATSPYPLGGRSVSFAPDLELRFRAMACDISLRVVHPRAGADEQAARAHDVFDDVERACTRFDPTSPLMRANAEPQAWHVVPPELFAAVAEAVAAHELTAGLFDPRVLTVLESYGYDRSLPFAAGDVVTEGSTAAPSAVEPPGPWQPELDPGRSMLRLGPDPIDLGGIGKGLAVRWAAEQLAGAGSSFLVEAGGDCHLAGVGPDGDGWKVGVEDPLGGQAPLAVLALVDRGCATSSVRLRHWRAAGTNVHHLIDPRTGRPGGAGLVAVTVVDEDAALAEVWSKSLFLCGAEGVGDLADRRGLAALWVHEDGSFEWTQAMEEHVVWRADG